MLSAKRLFFYAARSSHYNRIHFTPVTEYSHTPVHQRTSDNPHKIRFRVICTSVYLVHALCYSIIHSRSRASLRGLINSTYAHLHWVITGCPVSLSRDRYPAPPFGLLASVHEWSINISCGQTIAIPSSLMFIPVMMLMVVANAGYMVANNVSRASAYRRSCAENEKCVWAV